MTHIARSEPGAAASPALEIEQLLRPAAYQHAVSRLELRETHISWVILTGSFAYKIKKPVKFDFIDTSSLEQRRYYCQEELRLNQRLAPELYLDVVAISRTDGLVSVGGAGPAIEYAVRMRQFAAADELLHILARGEVLVTEVAALGELLARFHLNAAHARWSRTLEKTRQMYESVLGNLGQLIAHLEQPQPLPGVGRLVDWTHDNARSLETAFQMREQSGFIRECHGDLHAGNIVRSQRRLVPFDCLEFDPQLRWIDVINDTAFLVMDLASHRRNDLAFALLSRYLEVTGDYEGVRLLPFYAVYRALVRAKVDALSAEQFPQRAAEFRDRLRRRMRAAIQWTEPQRPVLILMHGPSGSGKSWLSERLGTALPAVRVRSDLERKRLAGISTQRSAASPVGQGIYSPEFDHRTYGRLSDCAESCLQAGFSVIVDAAFLDPADRELFQGVAMRLGVRYVIVSCRADPATLAARLLERRHEHSDPSDADLRILDAQLRDIQPFTAQELPRVVVADTNELNAAARVTTSVRSLAAA
jgi:aminoglycoside phosphotransferase family enzyme/predicted kinase